MLPLKYVGRLNDSLIDAHLEPESERHGFGRLARALEWRCDEFRERAIPTGEITGRQRGHAHALVGESKARDSTVEHAIGVKDLTVTYEMNLTGHHALKSTERVAGDFPTPPLD